MTLGSTLAWSKYLVRGQGKSIATDAQGNAYVIGDTRYTSYSDPVYVAKLSPTGAVLWAYGYTGTSSAHGIAADASGNVFILVWDSNESSSILAKLSGTTGNVLSAVTFPVGLFGLTLDGSGNAYLAGENGLPTSSISNVVVYKLTSSLGYVYGGIFGGSDLDYGREIRVDSSGNAYVYGQTRSFDLPAAQNAAFGSGDNFLAKIDPTGSSLLFTRYIGTAVQDYYGGMALDGAGNSYLGWSSDLTASLPALFPGSVQGPTGGALDGVIAKLSPSGAPIFSGRFGGASSEYVAAVAVDSGGAVSVSGTTYSADFPVTGNAVMSSRLGYHADAFVLQINASGTALSYSSYLGGTDNDASYAIALDGAKNVYLTGDTSSSDFPVTDGSVLPGAPSVFATKLLQSSDAVAPTCAITSPASGTNVSGTVSITANASDNVGVAKVEFFADGALIGSDLYAPYAGSWNTTGVAQGPHSLSCKAYDAAGNAGTSAAVSVTVNNATAPVCTLTWSRNPVPTGSGSKLTLTATGTIPGGSRSYLYGTRDYVPDFDRYDWGLPPYSWNFFNAPGNSGYYQRWVIIEGPDGSTVCTTNVASVFFQ